jgi:PAS domain S-box-containing protein
LVTASGEILLRPGRKPPSAELKKKNDELALVNKRLTNFFNTVSDGVMIVDRRERIIELNPAAKGLLGKKTQTVMGMLFGEMIDHRTSPKENLQPTREAFSDVEIMMDSLDGACHRLASGEPILNEHGEVTGGLIILRPIQQVQNLVHRFSGHYATLQFSDLIGESEGIREAVRLAREQRRKTVRESEKAGIIDLLNRHGGNVSNVAREMGVSRKTLYNKMRAGGIEN